MNNPNEERRKYSRYNTEMKVFFRVSYDVKTKVTFQVITADSAGNEGASEKYLGISRNISVEGLCFVSDKKLEPGKIILLEVYPPKVKTPVQMKGEVRWSQEVPGDSEGKNKIHTGVKLIEVNNMPVADSIYYDEEYKVYWSSVLETIFSSFKYMIEHDKGKQK